MEDYIAAFFGGILVGIAAVMMLLFNGRVLGISGIAGGILQKSHEKKQWRYLFLLGLFTGGVIILFFKPEAFEISISRSPLALIVAGLLVGFGTRLGSGCTSGHGVCGVSRLSPRSLMATLTFMFGGAVTVFILNHVLGGRV